MRHPQHWYFPQFRYNMRKISAKRYRRAKLTGRPTSTLRAATNESQKTLNKCETRNKTASPRNDKQCFANQTNRCLAGFASRGDLFRDNARLRAATNESQKTRNKNQETKRFSTFTVSRLRQSETKKIA